MSLATIPDGQTSIVMGTPLKTSLASSSLALTVGFEHYCLNSSLEIESVSPLPVRTTHENITHPFQSIRFISTMGFAVSRLQTILQPKIILKKIRTGVDNSLFFLSNSRAAPVALDQLRAQKRVSRNTGPMSG